MTVKVTHLQGGHIDTVKGTSDQILHQLLERFPWARRGRGDAPYDPSSLRDVVARLGGAQALLVEVSDV